MERAAPLFVLSLPSGGSIQCTEPAPKIYLITFLAPPDNRLTAPFVKALTLALDIIEHRFAKGVVVTTSGVSKFYSFVQALLLVSRPVPDPRGLCVGMGWTMSLPCEHPTFCPK